jgi:hypothetical protein
MADVQVQRVGGVAKTLSLRERYALLCYYYPRYSLQEAAKLPARDLNLLIRTAQKIQAIDKHDLVLIISAPHAKEKDSAKKLLEHFKSLAKD